MAKPLPRLTTVIARETAIGAVMNGLFSLAMFCLVFGVRDRPLAVWGLGHLAFDMLPQSFCVAFMSTLMAGLSGARSLGKGQVAPVEGRRHLPAAPVSRSLLAGVACAGVLAGLSALLLWALGITRIGWSTALPVKIVFGVLLGAILTPVMLIEALKVRS